MKKFVVIGFALTLFFVGCGPTQTESVHTDTSCVKVDSIKVDSTKKVINGKDSGLAKKGR